jgi:hypothetical protein
LGRVEALLSQVIGQPGRVRVEVVNALDGSASAANTASPPSTGARQLREKVKQLPQVQKARDLFGAEILQVDPEFGEAPLPATPPEDGHAGEPAAEE